MSSTKHPFRNRRALVAILAAAALGLSACGGDSADPDPAETIEPTVSETAAPEDSQEPTETAEPTPSITPANSLDDLEVVDGDIPELVIPAPWGIDETRAEVITEGGDQLLNENSTATLNYVGYNATTGEIFDSSWERGTPATFPLQGVVPGFQKGLDGQAVGSRVLIAMPSEDGYAQGNAGAGIEVGDTIVFLVDIISANFDEATGEEVVPAEGLPAVEMTDEGPELATPSGEVPAELVVQPLITGTGPEVQAGMDIQVKYRSWVWSTGALHEDAWYSQQGPLDTLIEGWKQGLAGQPVGSRVMLVVPPALAYPEGDPASGLEADQTLVYVIDILLAS